MATAYIALGSNLGDREAALIAAVSAFEALGMVIAVSSIYETDPVGYVDQPRFLNAAVALQTELDPESLLARLLAIEHAMGRLRDVPKGPRTIDLDLLMVDDLVIESPALTLPHPRLHERAFVLAPLRQVGGEAVHPVLHRTIEDLNQALPGTSGVEPWGAPCLLDDRRRRWP